MGLERAEAVVFLNPLGVRPAANADRLRVLFHFTHAEANLVLHLLEGLSLQEIGEVEGVTRETVKSHLHSVFVKTATHRQAELLVLIMSLQGTSWLGNP